MRLITILLFVISISSCNSKNQLKTEREFAKVYLDSLIKRHPTVHFYLNSDLTITSKKGDLDYTYYINNAYAAYKTEPNSINYIISRLVNSTADLYETPKRVNVDRIVPVIKPIEYLNEINSLNTDTKAPQVITEKYNAQLLIAYAEDSKNSIRYLTEDDFKILSISRDTLHSIALRNFYKMMPKIQTQGNNGVYMVTAGGDYEASLILLSSIWTNRNFSVDGEFVIAIPNRDLLLVTGSRNNAGIAKIKQIVADAYKNGNYQVSEDLFKWTGKTFEKFE